MDNWNYLTAERESELRAKYLDFCLGTDAEKEAQWQQKLAWQKRVDAGLTRSQTMVLVKEVHYESPIDGRAITSKQARNEDLARSGCVEYDPEMKTDYNRRIEREEAALESKIETSINASIAQMPAKKRESLVTELQNGSDIDILRKTA